MNKYVLIFPRFADASKVLVVRKDKPAFQKGRLNLIGGKIEEGETSIEAALRELDEEAGLTASGKCEIMGRVGGDWGYIDVISVPVSNDVLSPREEETEEVFWKSWSDLKSDPSLMPNLKIIIPLLLTEVNDWQIIDNGVSFGKARHEIQINVGCN